MYNYIEDKYKKKSFLNKFVREYFAFYILSFLLIIIFNFLKIDYYFYLWIIIALLIFYYKILVVVKAKTFLEKINVLNNISKFKEISKKEEKKLIVSILEDIKVKTRNDIKLIIEHYRSLNFEKGHSNNFWTIVAIIFAVLTPFVNSKGINLDSLAVALPTFLSVFFIIFISNVMYNSVISFARIISGKEQLYIRLEEMFTEIYINYEKYRKKDN